MQPRRILLPGGEGGAVAYGALACVPVSVPLLLALGLPFASFWDAGAFGFLAAARLPADRMLPERLLPAASLQGRIPTQLL